MLFEGADLTQPHGPVAAWAAQQLRIYDFRPYAAIGITRAGTIVAAAVFNKFVWPNIEINFARTDPRWATPAVVRRVFKYPFVELECRRITATTEATNHRARGFLCKLGFIEEGYHRDALPTGDAVSYGLLRKAAQRWLDGQAESRNSGGS